MEVIKRYIRTFIVMLAIDAQWNKAQTNDHECLGSNACSGAVLSGFNGVKCSGDRSCANAHLSGFDEYYFYGAYSAFNATIHSGFTYTDVYFWGYGAGYGAKIYCNYLHECTIYCHGNACSKTYLQCDGNCFIEPEDAIPPITILEASDLNYSLLYDSSIMTMTNNANCNQQPNQSNVFDASCDGDVDIRNDYGGTACFQRANTSSCESTTISVYTDTLESIVCGGYHSCMDSKIHANHASIYCEGHESCDSAEMNTSADLYCFGDTSCRASTIYGARSVYCAAFDSCSSSTFHATQNISIHFLGVSSGNESDIWCYSNTLCNIICGGHSACLNVQAYCHGLCVIECDDSMDCPVQHSWDSTTDPTIQPTWLSTLLPTIYPTDDTMMEDTIDPTPLTPETNDGDDGVLIIVIKNNALTTIIIAALVVVTLIVAGIVFVCCIFVGRKHLNKNEQQMIQKEDFEQCVEPMEIADEESEGEHNGDVDNDDKMPYTDEGPPVKQQTIVENMKRERSNSDFGTVELVGTSNAGYRECAEDNIANDEFVIKGDDEINQ
eukprot:277411_1